MDRGELSDAEWAVIGDLLPPERGRKSRPTCLQPSYSAPVIWCFSNCVSGIGDLMLRT